MRDITIGYLRPQGESFISNIIDTNNFLDAISHYVKVITITADLKDFGLRKLEDLDIDYLLVDPKNFGSMQFILREKQQINIPFIIILHTIYGWAEPLVQIIPLIRKEDIIISPSEYAKNSFLKLARKLKVHTIPHCLDVRKIQKDTSHKFKRQRKEICFMGRLIKEKGIGTLIKCMPKIISKVNNVHLNVIGPLSGQDITDYTKSPFVKKIEREIRKLKLTNNVHFMGLELGLDKYKILSQSDVFINPTISKEENLGVTNIEAFACGVPVIATNWAANRELVIDGENGYLIDINNYKNKKLKIDTEQLISLIVKVLKNKKLNLKLRENAIKTAQRFDYRKVMPKLVKLLKKKRKVKIKNRWELIKNKRVADFRHFFSKDSLFFLNYYTDFKTHTYASLYKRLFKRVSIENKYRSNRKKIKKKNTKGTKIADKIYHNFSDFLLLRHD